METGDRRSAGRGEWKGFEVDSDGLKRGSVDGRTGDHLAGDSRADDSRADEPWLLGFTRYEILVLSAAWFGWGFDVFDALLFNFVSRLCIPSLLGVPADPQTLTHWTGILTSVLLVGWAIGGIGFGMVTDRIGRARTLLVTMLTYALATAACAASGNIYVLLFFRFVASLGIGGEWAAGASLVAESVSESKRVKAGALLYTAAPAGLFLATFVTDLFTRQIPSIASDTNYSWRVVFLTGLIPAAAAIIIRIRIREPESWTRAAERPRIAELFQPELRRKTLGGLAMASVALITWWSCNAFLPLIASFLASDAFPAVAPAELAAAKAGMVTATTTVFNLGGLLGILLTVPAAEWLGRRRMFYLYFCGSALAIAGAFLTDIAPYSRIAAIFFVGVTVFGVFGSFTFYLPELFPSRLRGTGSGFCYNAGRFITSAGPLAVGAVSSHATSSTQILHVVGTVSLIPLCGVILLALGLGEETRDAR